MQHKIFFHGVPNSPAIWAPLLDVLDLHPSQVSVLSLPGFMTPHPTGFDATKEDYAQWAITLIKEQFDTHGPLDIIGHDWGALIVQRASMLVPDMIRSWVISGAVISPNYYGHTIAKIWNMPVLGESLMLLISADMIKRTLIKDGVPKTIALEESRYWRNWHMRLSILDLYRYLIQVILRLPKTLSVLQQS